MCDSSGFNPAWFDQGARDQNFFKTAFPVFSSNFWRTAERLQREPNKQNLRSMQEIAARAGGAAGAPLTPRISAGESPSTVQKPPAKINPAEQIQLTQEQIQRRALRNSLQGTAGTFKTSPLGVNNAAAVSKPSLLGY